MKFLGILLLLVCAATQPLTFAQSLAQSVRVVQGTVVNSDGQPIANAVVYLLSRDLGTFLLCARFLGHRWNVQL